MSWIRLGGTAFSVLLIAACPSRVRNYEPVEFLNRTTGFKTTCDQPISTWTTSVDAKTHLELAYDLRAQLNKDLTNLGSTGKFTGDLALVKEKVRAISQQSFEYMSFLYPFCKANAEGKLSDAEYAKTLKDLLDRFVKENAVSVYFDRTADMSGIRCADGKRIYSNVMTDVLRFSEPVKEYQAQALTNDTGGAQTAEIWYVVNGKKVTPIPHEVALPGKGKRQLVTIPVNGESVTVFYRYEQQVPADDNEWGLSFVSTLPIASIKAKVILPAGKQVSGLDNKDFRTANGAFGGCSFTAGASPTLECGERKLTTSPNVPIFLVWNWDVFAGC